MYMLKRQGRPFFWKFAFFLENYTKYSLKTFTYCLYQKIITNDNRKRSVKYFAIIIGASKAKVKSTFFEWLKEVKSLCKKKQQYFYSR